MGRGISRRVIGNSAVARAWASWKGESGNPWFDVATSKRVCKAGDGPRSWSLMKNRCALFPEHCYPREDGRGPADTEPPGVRVHERRCRNWLEWMPLQIKILRLCKFFGAEIPRRINTTRTASSSEERITELIFIFRLRCRAAMLASVESSANTRKFSVSLSLYV